jgi:hypothetical protein
VLIVLKTGSLNLQEASGPVQACNGIALPLVFTVYNVPHVSAFSESHHQEKNET